MNPNINIGIHQINTYTGDIFRNLETIKKHILDDKDKKADISIFPETAVTGYMCGSLWDRFDFVQTQYNEVRKLGLFLNKIDYDGTVIIGFVHYLGKQPNDFPLLKNAVAVITKDDFKIYHKQLLASADHHEDKKYFEPGNKNKFFKIKKLGISIGILICEDAWVNDHNRNIPKELVDEFDVDMLVNINQSYFYYGKQEKRIDLYSAISSILNIPYITVNSVGIGDILKNIVIFDGGSMIFDKGNLLFEAPRFEEFNEVINFSKLKPIEHKPTQKYDEICQALMFEQKQLFKQVGIPKAQVHISGGIDSAVTAALVYKSMGPENVVFITNPSSYNSDSFKYVNHLENKLNIKIWNNPIESIYNEFIKTHRESFSDIVELSDTGKATVQATLRTVQGLAASHQFKSGIVATGNHTEIVLGWASFHDIGSIGVHAILGDLTKMEIFEIAKYINEELFKDNIIPEDLYNGVFAPAAELPDALQDPINYELQSGICALLIRERKTRNNLIELFINHQLSKDLFPKREILKTISLEDFKKEVDFAIEKMRKSVYKAAQGAPIVVISPRSRGFSNRETLINHYSL